MKRLIPLFSFLLCLTTSGVNITNYPLTNNYSGNELFLLSSIPWKTNFNLPGNYVAKTSDLNSASNSILAQMPTTNGFVDASVTNGLVGASVTNGLQGALINPLTNGHSVAVTFSNSVVGTGTNYWMSTNVFAKPTLLASGAATAGNYGLMFQADLNMGWFLNGTYWSFGRINTECISLSYNDIQVKRPLKAQDTTESTSPTTGSAIVTAGLGVGKQLQCGSNGFFGGTLTATNGVNLMVKPSFTTNFTCTTNLQAYCCDGTNQLVTLPNAAYVANVVYRFSTTNGWGSVIITNATGAQSIRDGTSLSYTNIGIGEFGVFSDGACWRLASKGRTILPSASWSSATTITPAQDTITNIPWTDLEFNNSQGLTLRTNATFARPTELWITNAGTYMITFSAVLKGSGGGTVISLWLRENGSDVVRTRTDQGFTGATAQQCMTVNYFVNVGTAPKFYELVAASHDASPPTIVGATANPTGYTAPAMPAVIVTINRVSDPWP